MSDFINIDKENGETIMQHMESALGFPGWELLGALYDERRQHVRGFFAHDADTDVHCFWLKWHSGKLKGYNRMIIPPVGFVKYLSPGQVPGFKKTEYEQRIKQVFRKVITPELALALTEAGVKFKPAGNPD
jgi:hypothetical protein